MGNREVNFSCTSWPLLNTWPAVKMYDLWAMGLHGSRIVVRISKLIVIIIWLGFGL